MSKLARSQKLKIEKQIKRTLLYQIDNWIKIWDKTHLIKQDGDDEFRIYIAEEYRKTIKNKKVVK